MERPGDDFGETHNVVLQPRDQLFGGQVSRLQVSQLVGASVANTQLAGNKVHAPPTLQGVHTISQEGS